jgi:predicted dehydrogenase
MISAGLIGFGSAGSRFFRALIYRQKISGDIFLKAVCDSNINRLNFFKDTDIKIYQNVGDMIKDDIYDIIMRGDRYSGKIQPLFL